MSHQTRISWLKTASFILVGFGLLMFSTIFTPTAAILDALFDLAFLPIDANQAVNSDSAWLLTAITAGILVGWGEMIYLVTTRVYATDPSTGRAIILPAILAWYVVDSTGSVLSGGWFNAVMNLGFLALFLVPLIAPARSREAAG